MDTISGQSTASQRFLAAIGLPEPPPPTEEQIRQWDAEQDRVDAELRRMYGDLDETDPPAR